ncbi:hypothetical protein E2C01_067433 [Portunus trituberculatus]|uniref:Uncharacterized protein n=1 Tax=Portunus trituberculatus TaxID=210409 RepID=A0A5B7HTR3_PORTR|nr:hypothetical protein [Portunus trituberculatus]
MNAINDITTSALRISVTKSCRDWSRLLTTDSTTWQSPPSSSNSSSPSSSFSSSSSSLSSSTPSNSSSSSFPASRTNQLTSTSHAASPELSKADGKDSGNYGRELRLHTFPNQISGGPQNEPHGTPRKVGRVTCVSPSVL